MVYKERKFFGQPADVERQQTVQLEADVAAALAASGKVDAADVEVTVVSGTSIVLSGWVTDEDEINRCVETALAVPGVLGVESKISVLRGHSPSDPKA